MMNLFAMANRAVVTINPNLRVTMRKSMGYTISEDGEQVPSYRTFSTFAQLQSAGGGDLRHAEALNLQGDKLVAYLLGDWRGVLRPSETGGDLLIVDTGPWQGTWLVQVVQETWPTWSKLMLTLQNV